VAVLIVAVCDCELIQRDRDAVEVVLRRLDAVEPDLVLTHELTLALSEAEPF
jgi:hypothetical protein